MQHINMIMIYYWDKKLKKRLHVLETDTHETNVTAYNSTNNNVFFFVSDLKIVYYKIY